MTISKGGVSRILIVALCVVAILLVGVIYAANRFLYFGPALPQRDYLADYTQHGLVASGRSIEHAEAASEKLVEIEQILRSEILPALHDADAHLGMLNTEAEHEDNWPETEPVVLASLQEAERLGLRHLADELTDLGVFIDPNVIKVEGRDQMGPPRIATLRRLGHMESDFLVLAARAGDAEGVIEAYARIARLADLAASSGGGILVHLVAIALRSHGIEALLDALCERRHDQAFLDAVWAACSIEDDWPEISVVLEGELITSRHLSSPLGNPPLKTINPAYQIEVMSENYQAALDLWSSHPEGPVAGLRAFRERTADAEGPGLLADMLLPSTERYLAAVTQLGLLRTAERTVLAIERHRAATGALPGSLDKLVPAYLPALPTDPFSGQALAYAVEPAAAEGYRLYALGADGTDDGGVFDRQSRSQGTSLDAQGIDIPIVPRAD